MLEGTIMQRRTFIERTALAGAGVLAGPAFLERSLARAAQPQIDEDVEPDLEVKLVAEESEAAILDGPRTRAWSYRGEVLRGDASRLQALPDSYLGPIFRVRRGMVVRVQFINRIPDESVIHWHGLHVPSEMDGHPRYAVPTGGRFTYQFRVTDRAGMYWFHPHPHGITGPQVYHGLAGLFIVEDDEEQALGLPSGSREIPLVIQDREFTRDNQFAYLPRQPMDRVFGMHGGTVLVNGKPDAALDLPRAPHRLRILNGSNARIYKLAWSDGSPVTVLGADGGLLEAPEKRPYVVLGPAERADVWLDLSRYRPGTELTLRSLELPDAIFGHMGRMGGGMMGGMNMGGELELLKVRVSGEEGESQELPGRLASLPAVNAGEAVNAADPRRFDFFMDRMQPVINGRTFEMTEVAPEERVRLGTTEVWEVTNSTGRESGRGGMMGGRMGGGGMMGGGMMGGMQMPHPVHVHGLQFRVLEREVDDAGRAGWDALREGFLDGGPKDTLLLTPGMRARLLLSFRDYTGLYIYHCHNLEHEDLGMMRNYRVIG